MQILAAYRNGPPLTAARRSDSSGQLSSTAPHGNAVWAVAALLVSSCALPTSEQEHPVRGRPTLPDGTTRVDAGSGMDAGATEAGIGPTEDAKAEDASITLAPSECIVSTNCSDAGLDAGRRRRRSSATCEPQLWARVRDIWQGHPDFVGQAGATTATLGMVASTLGDDGTPAFRAETPGAPRLPYEWFHDLDGVNVFIDETFELTRSSDETLTLEELAYFPVDDRGFEREPQVNHNTYFTTHLRALFTYRGTEYLSITGNDDLWVFINGILAIDLGGVHDPQSVSVDLSDQATALGITTGGTYALDIFHAHRSPPASPSALILRTNMQCLTPSL